jgi:hypothetical protein
MPNYQGTSVKRKHKAQLDVKIENKEQLKLSKANFVTKKS